MKNEDKIERDFEFLRTHARTGTSFEISELADFSGRTEVTVRTYASKYWRGFLTQSAPGEFRVRSSFLDWPYASFRRLYSQKKVTDVSYERVSHPHVLVFDFFLPLSNENKLRRALDNLLYLDAIRERLIRDIAKLKASIGAAEGDTDEEYLERIVGRIGASIGGYSIMHVNGRFRAEDLLSRQDAALLASRGDDYFIDETTAVVRFILPLDSVRGTFDERGEVVGGSEAPLQLALDLADGCVDREAAEMRALFFLLFAEPLVAQVWTEDQIWLVESGYQSRLYKWVRTEAK